LSEEELKKKIAQGLKGRMNKFERRKTIFKGIFEEEEQKLPELAGINNKVKPIALEAGMNSSLGFVDEKGVLQFGGEKKSVKREEDSEEGSEVEV